MRESEIIITDRIYRPFNSNIKEIDPYNEDDVNSVLQFDKKHNTNYYEVIESVRSNYNKESYELCRMSSPVFKVILYSKNKKDIQSIYLVEYEVDLKKLNVYYSTGNKEMYQELEEYVFKNMNMESMICFIPKTEENCLKRLLNNGYIPLYDSFDTTDLVPLLIEKDEKYSIEKGSIICV